MSLNESFNYPNWKTNPIKKRLDQTGLQIEPFEYMIPGTHFPKWFRDKEDKLKSISEWYRIWLEQCETDKTITKQHFAPPRDAKHDPIGKATDWGKPLNVYKPLEQTHLILICPNGHLSDIPWPNYLRWRTEKIKRERDDQDKGEDLLYPDKVAPCCDKPDLKWTENRTKSEGYASVYIECRHCGMGNSPKVNLEGINSLQPNCKGEKPWEISLKMDNNFIPTELCHKMGDPGKGREQMRVTLVTGNNVYYANIFTSLYIPPSPEKILLDNALEKLIIKYENNKAYNEDNQLLPKTYFDERLNYEEFLADNNIKPADKNRFRKELRTAFVNEPEEKTASDTYNAYRWAEYACFTENEESGNEPGLKFNDIELPSDLQPYFTKIQQVEDLKVTNVQLDFTRVQPKQRIVEKGIVRETSSGQSIFSADPKQLHILPATEGRGEGLFFQFSDQKIREWVDENETRLKNRFHKFLNYPQKGDNEQLPGLKMRLKENHFKHFLIQTFSHLLMRELEFSCGYPTASLKERLYISNTEQNMSGVLIYTAEGAEGSMGGLVSQGEPDKINEILKKAFNRALTCSADPLCWESDGQGILDLNLAACFSCSLVSETACEEMNLGLDRQVLVDEEFGFFREMI